MNRTMNAKIRQARGVLRQQLGRLTDDQVAQLQGTVEAFIGQLQEKYGYNRAEASEMARDLFEQYAHSLKESVRDHLPEIEIHPSRAQRRRRRATWIRRTLTILGVAVATLFVVRQFQGNGTSQAS